MKISFLGGADEVGASSIHIETPGASILVDCGIKYSGSKGGLPCLSMLQDKKLDAILVTHAHLDHTGALPIINPSFPDTPVYMTPPSLDLISILLKDSLKIMNLASEREGEIPLYSEKAVDNLLSRVIPVGFCCPLNIPNTDVSFSFYPAGHILGAAMILLETPEGSVVITGDFSVQDQITVPGARKPGGKRRIVITESTYGNRLHANRKIEEKKLVQKISQVIETGGKVLVPAFALGRAQEVILILKHAMKKKIIPQFPVYVDGMIRSVCRAYSDNSSYLSPAVKKEIIKYNDPFFNDLECFNTVSSPNERKKILDSKACCIISSSGMLTGGPSQYYAAGLVEDSANLIAITGYQDEESPGRILLNAMNSDFIQINDKKLKINCKIEKYSLSAHADSTELAGFICGLKPSTVFLVHGDDTARSHLADLLVENRSGRIKLPQNGDEIIIDPPVKKIKIPINKSQGTGMNKPSLTNETGLSSQAGVSNQAASFIKAGFSDETASFNEAVSLIDADLSNDLIIKIKDRAEQKFGKDKNFTLHDLYTIYKFINKQFSNAADMNYETLKKFGQKLADSQIFKFHSKYNYLLKINSKPCEPDKTGPDILAIARSLPDEIRVLKSGLDHALKEVTLNLAFPLVHSSKAVDYLENTLKNAGWGIRINSSTHIGELKIQVDKLLKSNNLPGLESAVKVSIFNSENEIVVKSSVLPDQKILNNINMKLEKKTGFTLRFRKTSAGPGPKRIIQKGKFEINAAFALIESSFDSCPDRPYKKSKKTDLNGEFIELSFITPEIGEKNKNIIKDLVLNSGWRIEINKNPNQDALKNLAKQIVGEYFSIPREPSFFPVKKQILIYVTAIDDCMNCNILADAFYEKTCYNLEIKES
jgi:Cft2 family RNA processing exonuclease